jgi:hypothetical protein
MDTWHATGSKAILTRAAIKHASTSENKEQHVKPRVANDAAARSACSPPQASNHQKTVNNATSPTSKTCATTKQKANEAPSEDKQHRAVKSRVAQTTKAGNPAHKHRVTTKQQPTANGPR